MRIDGFRSELMDKPSIYGHEGLADLHEEKGGGSCAIYKHVPF